MKSCERMKIVKSPSNKRLVCPHEGCDKLFASRNTMGRHISRASDHLANLVAYRISRPVHVTIRVRKCRRRKTDALVLAQEKSSSPCMCLCIILYLFPFVVDSISLSARIDSLLFLPNEYLEQFYFSLIDPIPLESWILNGQTLPKFEQACMDWNYEYESLKIEIRDMRDYRDSIGGIDLKCTYI
jgi:hypothetical protein